jgi:hypothetical protein
MPEFDSSYYLRKFLYEGDALAGPDDKIAVDARAQLSFLLAAKIPPTYRTAEGLYEAFAAMDDIESIQLMHDHGESCYLLAKTSLHLFIHQLLSARANDRSVNPLQVFKKIVSRSVRIRAESRFHALFLDDLIGRGEITHFDLQFAAMAEHYYGPGSFDLSSCIHGLRGMVNQGILTLVEEEKIEEWLLKKLHIERDDRDYTTRQVRESRAAWQLRIQDRREELPATDNPDFNRGKLRGFCERDELDEAIAFLKQIPADQQVDFSPIVLRALYRARMYDQLLGFLAYTKHTLDGLEVEETQKSYDYAGLVSWYVLAADNTGIIEVFKGINESGYDQLLLDLGVEEWQFVILFFFCYMEGLDIYFKSHSHVDIKTLFDGRYHRDWDSYDSYSVGLGARMYASLVAARVFHFGEEGIEFPSNREYLRKYEVPMAVYKFLKESQSE